MTGVELDATLSGQRLFKKEVLEKSPKIISVRYSDEFLAIIQKWKNKNTSNKES